MEYNTDYGTGNKRNTVLYGFEKPVPESTASSLFDITQYSIGKMSACQANVKPSIFRLTVLQAMLKH